MVSLPLRLWRSAENTPSKNRSNFCSDFKHFFDQFGDLDIGYTVDAPGLGEPKEPKGPHKSSGYGTLSEDHKGSCKTTHPDMSHDEYEASLEEGEFDSIKREFEKKPTNKFSDEEKYFC